MDLKSIEKLEGMMLALVEKVRDLRTENLRLKEYSARMEDELEAMAANEKKYRDKLEKLAKLEHSSSKMEAESVNVRLKVQSMLAELEKIDWS